MANIQLKVVALGDFTSVNAQLKALQTQVQSLQKSIAGVGLNTSLSTQLKNIQTEFSNALVSSGNFTKQTVQLTSETEKFGQALQSGKLKLGDYFGIITGRSAAAQKSVQALALEQVKLNNSIVQQDITKQGVYSVYTPTAINQTSKAVELAAAKQNIFNIAVREGSNQLINFGKNTQWAGRQLTVGLSMPVLLFGSQAMKTFQDVNSELVRMQKVYGTGLTQPTKAALDTIKTQVTGLGKELASSMGVAVKDTAAMAADLAATGKTGNDLIVATREAMRLSKLGELDTQSAMKATISLQNVYKLSTQDLSGAVNFLNAVENQTSTSLQDLVDGIPRVGPIVQQLGGSFKDTAVMMVAMKEAGVPAAQSANAIKSAIASLINPTKAAKEAFALYNINLAGIATSTKGNPVQMIMQLQSALKGLAPLAQAQLIEKLFGKFQEARIQALITNLGAVNSQTRTAFDLVNATAPQLAAVAASEMKIATESTTGKFKRAVETLKADLIPVGQKIMEVATSIMNFGAKIASFFNNLPGPIKNGLGILLTLGAIAGPVIMITGLFANLLGQTMKVGYSLLSLFDGTKKWRDLMTPAGIAAKTATEIFQTGLLENVTAVDTLNAALQKLIVSIEAINVGLGASTGTSLIAKVESGLAGGKIPFKAPGFASGGIVPGAGSGDTYPAMLTPGESVVTKEATRRYAPVINAMNNGNLPGFAYGVTSAGEQIDVQRGHILSDHPQSIFNTVSGMLGQAGLTDLQSTTRGAMIAMPGLINQRTKEGNAGISAGNALSEYMKVIDAQIDPMQNLKNVAQKLGANMEQANTQLDSAFKAFISGLREAAKNPTHPGFGKNAGQIPFEEFAGQYFNPAMSSVPTAIGGNLGAVANSVVGTRGTRIGSKSGRAETAGTMVIQPDGSVVPFNKSYLTGTLSENDVATKSSYAMDNVFKRVSSRAKQTLGIKSPSTVMAEEVGLPISQGIAKGIDEGAPVIEKAIVETTGGTKARLGSLMSRYSSMGMMGRMGVGMAAGTVAQMASPLINQIPGGSFISSAMSGGAMGAAFGPWGVAAGAALSLVTHGITTLMATEKQHAAEAKADFTSSASAVEFLGGKVVDATSHLQNLNIILNNPTSGTGNATKVLGANIAYTNQQLDSFATMVKSLPKENALALVVKQVKDASDSGSAAKIASEFATLQMAINNINPTQAKQLEQLILTVGGKDASASRTPASNQIDAIKSSLNSALPNSKQFAQVIGQITSSALNSNSLDSVNMAIKAIGASSATAEQQVAGLLSYFTQLGNSGAMQLITAMQNAGGFSGGDILKTLAAYQAGAKISFPTLSSDLKSGVIDKTLTAANESRNAKIKEISALQDKLNKLQNANTSSTIANGAAIKASLPYLTAQQKVLDANLKSLQDLQRQQNQNISYATTKEDLKNQILMAQSTGDNLKAQMLRQQLLQTTSGYNLQNKIDAAQQYADRNRLAIDNANIAATNAQTSAQNANTKAINDLQGQISAAQKGLDTPTPGAFSGVPKIAPNYGAKSATGGKGHATGGTISGPGSSTSDSIPAMLSNGEYVVNAGAVSHYGKGFFDAANAMHLKKGGVARTNSSITYHKQHMNRTARHFATGGYVPSQVSGLMSLSNFPHFAAGGAVNAAINSGSNIVYNVNVNVDKIDSTVDMRRAIDDALKSAEARAKMSGRVSHVGVN